MVKKTAHPKSELFEYLNGAVAASAARVIEAHLSVCDDCASAARLVRELKESDLGPNRDHQSEAPHLTSEGEHPDISELASFFYTKSRSAGSSQVAAHVARCNSCGNAIAQYARGEHAAAEYNPASVSAGHVPANAWEMIRDWEESSFAKLKPASEVLGQELLAQLAQILDAHGEHSRGQDTSDNATRVPVLVVSRSGVVRSVEFFERGVDETGAKVLRHSEGSTRFDHKPLLALFGFGDKESFVVSNPIHRDTIRLEKARPEEDSLRADYIIIED